jgi:hypothetical protein
MCVEERSEDMENENEQVERPQGQTSADEAAVLQKVIAELTPLSWDSRQRMIDTVCTFFSLERKQSGGDASLQTGWSRQSNVTPKFSFSEKESLRAKQFIVDKAPTTDIERVACLAYYLTHYRNTPHFKTKDITDLNIDAAQRRFSNAAYAVTNAANAGLLVPSVKGCKQLSAPGEQFVQALPDHEAAREAFERVKWRRVGKRPANKADTDA